MLAGVRDQDAARGQHRGGVRAAVQVLGMAAAAGAVAGLILAADWLAMFGWPW